MDYESVQSKITDFNINEEFSNLQEIILGTDVYSQDIFYLRQYGEVVERYLQRKGPHLLRGKPIIRESYTNRWSDIKEFRLNGIPSGTSTMSPDASLPSLRHTTSSRRTTLSNIPLTMVNMLEKINIVEREIDENKIALEKLRKRFKSADFLLTTEEENLRADVMEAEKMESLLCNFVTENTDEKKKQIIYDKFYTFLENELENEYRKWRKIRIKNRALEIDFNRAKSQQQRKLEAEEHLHPIDIDKLNIEQKKHQELLEQRTNHLKDLKRVIGRKGQAIVSVKSKINEIIVTLKKIRKDNIEKEAKLALLEKKRNQDESKLQTAEEVYGNIKRLHTSYKCAGVSQYMKTEAALSEAKREKEYWEKRFLNAKKTMMFLEQQVRKITPSSRAAKLLRKTKSAMSKNLLITPGNFFNLSLKLQ